MPLTPIISNAQQRSKDSFASSPSVGLALLVNGEETPKVIDANGNVYRAGILAPTVAPVVTTIANVPASGMPAGYRGYVYVYASSRFPFVESDSAINGRLWPRSNFSPCTVANFAVVDDTITAATVTKPNVTGIDTIWIFRTARYATSAEALTAGEAGAAFFHQEITGLSGAGTSAWTDNNPVDGTDQVQADNFVASQMQFAVFYDPYWWGFGNLPFSAAASWTDVLGVGVITLTGTDTWFDGRNGQNVSLPDITAGGFDGNGTFKFLWLTSTTANVTIDGVTPVALGSTGSPGLVTVQGPATALYRSKPRNPFAWGFTQSIGSANVPQEYAFKIGGGLGSALAVIPNNATLKLDCEYPAKCYTLNLRTAGTSAFESSLRIISDVYSVTAHFSQFPAVTANGNTVLWGMDFKNFAIVQCDGNSQVPISTPIPRILRALTKDRTRQLLTHGVYDPLTELNCMWVSPVAGLSLISYLIYQHAPTGFWGFSQENDILCSATIQDTLTGGVKTFVGTQTGILGQALVQGVYNNFLPDTGAFTGTCTAATATTITTAETFNLVDHGIIGNWCLITNADGEEEQLARISARTANTLTFDWIRSAVGGGTAAFNPVPVAGAKFYVGLIECRLLKYFDFSQPQTDKQLMELWLTQQSVDASTTGTLIRYYRERETGYTQFAPLQDEYADATGSDVWFVNQEVPSELVKSFGLEIINRGYEQWRMLNLALKPRLNP